MGFPVENNGPSGRRQLWNYYCRTGLNITVTVLLTVAQGISWYCFRNAFRLHSLDVCRHFFVCLLWQQQTPIGHLNTSISSMFPWPLKPIETVNFEGTLLELTESQFPVPLTCSFEPKQHLTSTFHANFFTQIYLHFPISSLTHFNWNFLDTDLINKLNKLNWIVFVFCSNCVR